MLLHRHSPYLFKHYNVQSMKICANGETYPSPEFTPKWTGSAKDFTREYLALFDNTLKQDQGCAITPEMFEEKGYVICVIESVALHRSLLVVPNTFTPFLSLSQVHIFRLPFWRGIGTTSERPHYAEKIRELQTRHYVHGNIYKSGIDRRSLSRGGRDPE